MPLVVVQREVISDTGNSLFLTGLAREAQKRETGSIESEEDLRVDLGGL